ncbi:MAG: hypothetical protein ACOZNI_06765 [Myxococcota bacterium]
MPVPACDPGPPLDWRQALDPGQVVVFGEMHGTAEAPRFVLAAACTAMRAGRTVGVAIEWPASLQPIAGDRAALLESEFLTVERQDGRRSVAMLDLVETVSRWRAAGAPVELLFVDPADDARDAGMATRTRAWLASHPEGVEIVLVGNVHARRTRGFRENADYEPLAFRLADLGPRLVALDQRYGAGFAWNCQRDGCGPHALGRADADLGVRIEWEEAGGTYDGTWWVGTPTASEPAVGGARR